MLKMLSSVVRHSTTSSLEEEEGTPRKKARLDDEGSVSPSFWRDACQLETPCLPIDTSLPVQRRSERQEAHVVSHSLVHEPPMLHSPSATWKCDNPKCIHYSKPDFGLKVDYYPKFLKPAVAREIFKQLEKELVPYLERSQNQVKIMGKVHKIPRKQAAFGDVGLSYNFSGVSVPAHPWISPLNEIRDTVMETLGEKFNFVLVNRYKDGSDHIGEHRDDEKDLVSQSSIASVSLGQGRDFVFKHREVRGKAKRKDIESVRIHLEHGSLLAMKYPTNTYWYHSLPVRKTAAGPRINLTFRLMKL